MTDKKIPKKRVLMLCDFACASGFAQISQNVVAQLIKEKDVQYQIDIVGINYYGVPNEWLNLFPQVRIFPAQVLSNGDLFGRSAYLSMLSSGAYDITWILQDTFQIEVITDKMREIRNKLIADGQKPFKFIFYYPIDGEPKENWITKSVSVADIPVAYTKFGYEKSVKYDKNLEGKLKIIPHGVDTAVFKELDEETVVKFRKNYFMGLADDKFLVTNINRNQPRKDIPRTLQIFKLFKQQVPNALLYLHMKKVDNGWNIDELARNFELIPDEDYIVPVEFEENQGIDVSLVNAIYNASDVVMTTTLGEGWGLSMTEAMAAKTPVIAPDHTSLTEMLADNRGVLVPSGKHVTEWVGIASTDNNQMRPIVSVPDYVDKLVDIYRNPKKSAERVENAYKYVVENLTWDIVGQQWRDLFKLAIPSQKLVKIGRNDPCDCGSGKKYKLCHGRR